jgi:hypothetical protein
MFTQFLTNCSNSKSYGNCSALELFHADRLSYVPHGWEHSWNRCVNSAFAFSRVISRWRGSKNWNMSFPHESLKTVHGPLFFLAPNSTTHTIPDKRKPRKIIRKTKVFMVVCVAFPVTAPCSLVRGYRTFGGTQCLYVQGSRGCVWPYLYILAELTKVKLDYCYACVFLKGLHVSVGKTNTRGCTSRTASQLSLSQFCSHITMTKLFTGFSLASGLWT